MRHDSAIIGSLNVDLNTSRNTTYDGRGRGRGARCVSSSTGVLMAAFVCTGPGSLGLASDVDAIGQHNWSRQPSLQLASCKGRFCEGSWHDNWPDVSDDVHSFISINCPLIFFSLRMASPLTNFHFVTLVFLRFVFFYLVSYLNGLTLFSLNITHHQLC